MKLNFLLDWELSEGNQLAGAEDGLWEAIRLLSQEWDIEVFVCNKNNYHSIFPHKYFPINLIPQKDMAQAITKRRPDHILVWADLTRPTLNELVKGDIPISLCFSGGETNYPVAHYLHTIFVESQTYEDKFKSRGLNVKRAFGVNDRIFRPIKQPKIFDAVFPATFADWKRHSLFANSVEKGFCFGYMYDTHEQWCWKYPQDKGIMIAPHLSHEVTAYVINSSYSVLITSNTQGGSQRTVLEAMACEVPPIVMSDSEKCSEYVRESGFGFIVEPNDNAIKDAIRKCKEANFTGGRKYIESKFTANHYKEAIKVGILKC